MRKGSHDSVGDFALSTPLQCGLILQRLDTGVIATDVPHNLVHHSPNGFEYGYGGSGPADLALNIAEYVVKELGPSVNSHAVTLWDGNTCSYEAWLIHHDLKYGLLGPLDREKDHKISYGIVEERVRYLLRHYADEIREEKEWQMN